MHAPASASPPSLSMNFWSSSLSMKQNSLVSAEYSAPLLHGWCNNNRRDCPRGTRSGESEHPAFRTRRAAPAPEFWSVRRSCPQSAPEFRAARSGVGCIVVDTEEQVRRGTATVSSAAQCQLAAFLKGIAHHDNLCPAASRYCGVLRHIQIDVLLIERTAVVSRRHRCRRAPGR